jgi:hypothetical protein
VVLTQHRSLRACLVGAVFVGAGLAAGLALGESDGSPGVVVMTSAVYPGATPASPQGMPSQAAANQAESILVQPSGDGDNSGVTVITSATYPNATPASPQGMPSQAAADQAAAAASPASAAGLNPSSRVRTSNTKRRQREKRDTRRIHRS